MTTFAFMLMAILSSENVIIYALHTLPELSAHDLSNRFYALHTLPNPINVYNKIYNGPISLFVECVYMVQPTHVTFYGTILILSQRRQIYPRYPGICQRYNFDPNRHLTLSHVILAICAYILIRHSSVITSTNVSIQYIPFLSLRIWIGNRVCFHSSDVKLFNGPALCNQQLVEIWLWRPDARHSLKYS